MLRKKTSKKQEFCFSDIPTVKLRPRTKVVGSNSAKKLRDPELIFRALWQCLIEQDLDSFKDILRSHLDATNKQTLSKKANTSRRTLHRILSQEGNPTLKSISKVLAAMYG